MRIILLLPLLASAALALAIHPTTVIHSSRDLGPVVDGQPNPYYHNLSFASQTISPVVDGQPNPNYGRPATEGCHNNGCTTSLEEPTRQPNKRQEKAERLKRRAKNDDDDDDDDDDDSIGLGGDLGKEWKRSEAAKPHDALAEGTFLAARKNVGSEQEEDDIEKKAGSREAFGIKI